jgi:UDP-N-acetyl-D-glucosamine dehydrogenase
MGSHETLQKIKSREAHIGDIKVTRAHPHLAGQKSLPFSSDTLDDYDAVVILTDHRAVDYALLASHARLIVDTRSAMRGMELKGKLVKA